MTTTTLHPGRLGYQGPGIPMARQRGNPATRRERWGAALLRMSSLTSTCIRVVQHLARYGDPDGSRVYPSQERLARDLGLSTGTISRAVCEAEDAGALVVTRWRPFHDASGRFSGRRTNRYVLALPPQGFEGGKRRRRRRSGPTPQEHHRRAVEEAKEARRALIQQAIDETLRREDEAAMAELARPALGAWRRATTAPAVLPASSPPTADAAPRSEQPQSPERRLLDVLRSQLGKPGRRAPPPPGSLSPR